MNIIDNIIGVGGEYKICVIDVNGNELFPFGDTFHKNVITDIGLDRVLSTNSYAAGGTSGGLSVYGHPFLSSSYICRAGSGNTPTSTSDTALVSQSMYTSTLPDSASLNFTDTSLCVSSGIGTWQRTFDFAAVGSTTTVAEVGTGWSNSDPNTLFSRFVLPRSITLTVGQILRVTYRLSLRLPSYTTDVTTNLQSGSFNATGVMRVIGTPLSVWGELQSNGGIRYPTTPCGIASIFGGYITYPAPSSTNDIFCKLCSAPTTLPSVGSAPPSTTIVGSSLINTTTRSQSGVGVGASPKYIDRVFTIPYTSGVSSSIRSVRFSPKDDFGVIAAIYILFNSNQTKDNLHTLKFGLRTTLARL